VGLVGMVVVRWTVEGRGGWFRLKAQQWAAGRCAASPRPTCAPPRPSVPVGTPSQADNRVRYVVDELDMDEWMDAGLARFEHYLACWRRFSELYP
jgi:hypothetical protein